ncbi:MAG: ATP-binding cassette domain-containing protein [Bacilli bacterium]|nr:ATP-binding cassette domain-containing protein [Bacilli bacterium]
MKEAIRFENVTKKFGKVIANQNVSFSVEKGKIYAILGENGSGKTTLMNVIAGIYRQDAGKVYINGKEADIKSPIDAYRYQVGMIHQHFKLVDAFTAAENMTEGLKREDSPEYKVLKNEEKELGTLREIKKKIKSLDTMIKKEKLVDTEILRNQSKQAHEDYATIRSLKRSEWRVRRYNLRDAKKRMDTLCKRYGFILDPSKHVYDMSVSEKQTLEIVKAINRGADILILDEPTAVLTPQETQHLFKALRSMKEHGHTIIIITHKLNEVKEISDKVVILRQGKYVGEIETKKATIDKLTELMVGKKISLDIKRTKPVNCKERLIVKNLSVQNGEGGLALDDVSFTAYSGEILGIAGISGNGQKELLEAIAGLYPISKGKVTLINPKKDQPLTIQHKTFEEVKKLSADGMLRFKDGSPTKFQGLLVDIRNLVKLKFKTKDKKKKAEIAKQIQAKKAEIKKIREQYKIDAKKPNANVKELRRHALRKVYGFSNHTIQKLVDEKKIIFNDNEIVNLDEKDPRQIREAGIHLSFVPEDRLGMGLVGNMDIVDNMMLRTYKHGRGVFVHREKPGQLADKVIKELEVVTPSKYTRVATLSGGNIQKVLVGREIAFSPKVFMTAYPVRGLDINSSYAIYNLLQEQKRSGVAVMYVGEDLDVLLDLCDRILVLAHGKVTGIFDATKVTKEKIGLLMTGGKEHAKNA